MLLRRLGDERIDVDAVDEVDAGRARSPSTSTSSAFLVAHDRVDVDVAERHACR